MPGREAGGVAPAGRRRTLEQVYRQFGESGTAGASPLQAHVAVALAGSGAALRVLGTLPARRRRPALVLAVLHDLALAGRAPALAAAYAAADPGAAGAAAVDTVLRLTGMVEATAARRQLPSSGTTSCAVLHPAIAEAAHRAGASAVGLIDVGDAAGLNLQVDRVGVACSDGQFRGDRSSPVQLTATVVGHRSLPARAVPPVVSRVAVGTDLVDVTDPDDGRWLRACLPPDRPEQLADLEAVLCLAATSAPSLLRGDVVDVLPAALAQVPAGALPVVTTTWALSSWRPEARLRFLHRLHEVAAGRAVAWVSAEGVGVAPSVPTLGDRRASGHSLIGLALLDGSTAAPDVLGRCWSRGRLLSWLADP
ncbi:hypothetical protein GCM10009616_15450 [Microlunatus lacustris]